MWDGFSDWYARARRVIDGRDLLLLTPVGVVSLLADFARQRLSGQARPAVSDEVGDFDPELVEVAADLFRALARYYFRLEVSGVEHVPLEGPALLVGNHNGAVLPLDTVFTALAVYDHTRARGAARLVRTLGHDSVFSHRALAGYARRLGAVRASPPAAEALLRKGELGLVYPGSDWEACRTFGERHRIILAGRRGFLRLALRTGVPIVPVVSVGTHEQLLIVTRGERLARALRLHKLMRSDTFPLALSLPWGLNSALLPYLPLPAQTSLSFGAPLRFPDVTPEQADDEAVLDRCYAVVETQMQAMLDELSRDRIPFLGRLR
jgi:1-acyl-sn-glycerol-3-phosphate acyltransferase